MILVFHDLYLHGARTARLVAMQSQSYKTHAYTIPWPRNESSARSTLKVSVFYNPSSNTIQVHAHGPMDYRKCASAHISFSHRLP
jgi:hypothetical protein